MWTLVIIHHVHHTRASEQPAKNAADMVRKSRQHIRDGVLNLRQRNNEKHLALTPWLKTMTLKQDHKSRVSLRCNDPNTSHTTVLYPEK